MRYQKPKKHILQPILLSLIGIIVIILLANFIKVAPVPKQITTPTPTPTIIFPYQFFYKDEIGGIDNYFLYYVNSKEKKLVYSEKKIATRTELELLNNSHLFIAGGASGTKKIDIYSKGISRMSRGDIFSYSSPNEMYTITFPVKPFADKINLQITNNVTQIRFSIDIPNSNQAIPSIVGWSEDESTLFISFNNSHSIPQYVISLKEKKLKNYKKDKQLQGIIYTSIDSKTNRIYFLSKDALFFQDIATGDITKTSIILPKTQSKLSISTDGSKSSDTIIFFDNNHVWSVNIKSGVKSLLILLKETEKINDLIFQNNYIVYTVYISEDGKNALKGFIYNMEEKKSVEFITKYGTSQSSLRLIDWFIKKPYVVTPSP